jgi:hypothetical protein
MRRGEENRGDITERGRRGRLLPDNPEIGRAGRVAGTRELVIPKTPFIVPYRVNGHLLEILRIYHVTNVGRKFSEIGKRQGMAQQNDLQSVAHYPFPTCTIEAEYSLEILQTHIMKTTTC